MIKPKHVCTHLRTKKMYIPALAHEVFDQNAEDPAHSAHCWCNCTLTETGPDDKAVGVEVCSPERSCFEE